MPITADIELDVNLRPCKSVPPAPPKINSGVGARTSILTEPMFKLPVFVVVNSDETLVPRWRASFKAMRKTRQILLSLIASGFRCTL